MTPKLATKLKGLPRDPGVYLMKDSRGDIIYVGKARDLKARVTTYFGSDRLKDPKTHALVRKIADFEVMITKTEVEALLLERTLIKHHKPAFNVLLRDDKEYPYLRIDLNEEWPRIEKVRRRKEDGAVYLGPYGSAGQLKVLLDATYRIFPLIRCSRHEFKTVKRPCNYYHMKMCLGPCTLPVERDHYVAMMRDAISFLQGRKKELVRDLKEKMQKASDAEQYEYAALLRDQLRAFEVVTERQSVVVEDVEDADALGFHHSETRSAFHVLSVREGFLIGNDSFVALSGAQDEKRAMLDFLLQYYDARSLPREILLPFPIDDMDDVKLALLEGHPDVQSLTLKVPSRGARLDLVDMANKNAAWRLEEAERAGDRQRMELEILREKLGLTRFPRRMECIDISNIQGTAIVASDVCFVDGRPAKEHYRHYVIQDVSGAPDDFASIREVVRRRIERGLREGDLPDLLVIDGGRGQLSAAMDALSGFGSVPIDLVSLAKSRVDKKDRKHRFVQSTAPQRSFERVFFPDRELPLALTPGTPEYRLLTRIRDEAHRFAITHHRKRRAKLATGSDLEAIPGIGPAMRKKLLETFGSLEGLSLASLDDLRAIPGLREATAVALYSHFRSAEEEAKEG